MSDLIENSELESEIEEKFVFDAKYKKQLIQYGIFVGMLFFVFFVLMLFTLAARDSWEYGLRGQVAEVLGHSDIEISFSLGQMEAVDSPFAVSLAVFPLIEDDEHQRSAERYAVIIRIPTLFGPVPAVFLYEDGQKAADFIGFATLNKRIEAAVESNARHTQIAYWGKRIPAIIGKKD